MGRTRTRLASLALILLLGALPIGIALWAITDLPKSLVRSDAIAAGDLTERTGPLTRVWADNGKAAGYWVWGIDDPTSNDEGDLLGMRVRADDHLESHLGQATTAWTHDGETLQLDLPDGRTQTSDSVGWTNVFFAVLVGGMNLLIAPWGIYGGLVMSGAEQFADRHGRKLRWGTAGGTLVVGMVWAHVQHLPQMLRVDAVLLPYLAGAAALSYGLLRAVRWTRSRRASAAQRTGSLAS